MGDFKIQNASNIRNAHKLQGVPIDIDLGAVLTGESLIFDGNNWVSGFGAGASVVSITGPVSITGGITGYVGITGPVEIEATNPLPITGFVGITGGVETIFPTGGPNFDAFNRLRVSNPQTLFDSKQLTGTASLSWSNSIGAGGSVTYDPYKAHAILTSNGATVYRQTFRRFNYQPGKSQLILMTGVFGAGEVGVLRRIGMFNDENGLFFEQDGDMYVAQRSQATTVVPNPPGTPIDTRVIQSSWNVDPMDGTGPSGVTLDPTKTQIMIIDFEWLGVGRVRMGWIVDGMIYYCHCFKNANVLEEVYMSTPNLPLRYEITSTVGARTLMHNCTSVISEGGSQDTGFPHSVTRDTGLTTLNNSSLFPLIAIRIKSNQKSCNIKLQQFSIMVTNTALFSFRILLNPTVTGTAFSFSSMPNSCTEYDRSRDNTTTVSGGTEIYGEVGASQSGGNNLTALFEHDFSLGFDTSGVADVLVLAVQRLSNQAETFYGSVNWLES